MNAKEVATLLGVHPNTIYSMIREGNIKAEKKGRSFDIPQWQVDELKGWQDISKSGERRKREHLQVLVGYEQELSLQLWNFAETTKAFQDYLKSVEFQSFSQAETDIFLKEQYRDESSLLQRLLKISDRIKELQTVINNLRNKIHDLEEKAVDVIKKRWDFADFSDIELNELPAGDEVDKE